MNDSQDNDETLLPDDADRKIDELLTALRESEEEMMGESQLAAEGSAESGTKATTEAQEEDFLSDGEGDFVDLDAEQLDNSTDKLQLDEAESQDEWEQEFEGEPALESDFEAGGGGLDRSDAEQDELEANELARARLDELEQKLAAVESAPLHVPAPAAKSNDSFPSGLSALLALVALLLSGAALWLAYSDTPAAQTAAVTTNTAEAELQGLKQDLAAMRKRLGAVEKQAEQGGEETVAMLDRMQTVLVRMEKRIVSRSAAAPEEAQPVTETGPAADNALQQAAMETDVAVVDSSASVAVMPKPVEGSVEQGNGGSSTGKVFVKGWAVNLRSYYHRVDAERLMQRYQKAGIDAQIREIPKGDATWYRVRVMGFASKKEADAFIEGLTAEQGRENAWPSYYQGYVDG